MPAIRSTSEKYNELLLFLNDKWKEELGMQAEINTLHPDADMDAYMKHNRNMAMYAEIFEFVRQNAGYFHLEKE